ncbi:phosphosulfolactate synthase [Alicyclobacillus sacchari]|uniref:Phosphosulfolactate synthase n=1 Tax=Alicyclobacillus sacchari TaxID=392010 RepID=A0A4R8LUY5_9BACL|nr:phosphosulfolactate synthase [Alicyclobacillus sacchari]TDY51368.1 phosphosulfolactate synthase [Alicyclobacillus sacchari]GMA56690.1 phosphosulfolactate synthase [Alicyclobacillus sacchari]
MSGTLEVGLRLPSRAVKPRLSGLTIVIDNGVPLRHFEDVMESASDLVDLVKFGWGTSLVTPRLVEKIACLRRLGIDYFFGGTLFEKFYVQNQLEAYEEFCKRHECNYVEISNGTVPMTNAEKCAWITHFSERFQVLSEVGYKDVNQSLMLPPNRWIQYIQEDFAAGARYVITEARESGTSGICRENGELRFGLIEEILDANIEIDKLVFEAPNKSLQTHFIEKVGSNVNLANVPFADIIPLETLRLGLRSDTFMLFEN